jgi:rod shape determining protein RodA
MELSLQIEDKTFLRRLDWTLICFILFIQIIGLINLYSATHGPNSKDVEPLFVNQLVWLGVGWGVFFIVTLLDYSVFSQIAWIIFVLNFAAIVYVNFHGRVTLGAQRWIDLGAFHYQPSETIKLALILLLAKILSIRSTFGSGMGFKELAIPALCLFLPFVLIAKQPDLGTGLMVIAIGGSMLIFSKVKRYILVGAMALGLAGAYFSWSFVLRDYQKNRVLTFLSPTNDPRGTGYNSIQSKIAVGSGNFAGKGFRKGTQSQLEFLPERHTDFIFSVLSEEWGFMGSFLTLSLFGWLFVLMIRIATNAREKFGALLCVGVLCYIFWHMFVNVGMVIGLLPIVGVPLPLLSYGGSSMLTTMAGLGLVSSVAYRRYLF